MADKKITDLQQRATVSGDISVPVDDGIQSYRITMAQIMEWIRPMPVGSLLPFAGTAAPDGFLLCAGQAVSRATYAALFAIISTAYGAGDGTTTFNLPDLRGRVPVGKDNMGGSAAGRVTNAAVGVDAATLGAAGGSQTHQLTEAQMPLHSHTDSGHAHTLVNVPYFVGGAGQSGPYVAGAGPLRNAAGGSDYNHNGNTAAGYAQISGTGGNAAHPNVQPSIVLNYLIKN